MYFITYRCARHSNINNATMRRIAIEAPIASAHNSVPCTPDAVVASPSSPSAAFRYAADKFYKKIAWQVKDVPCNGVITHVFRLFKFSVFVLCNIIIIYTSR